MDTETKTEQRNGIADEVANLNAYECKMILAYMTGYCAEDEEFINGFQSAVKFIKVIKE